MKDIEMLLGPITDRYFQSKGDINIAHIYDEVCTYELERANHLKDEIELIYNKSLETFTDVPEEDRALLQHFSFICSLSLDVYAKKLLIEKLIDEMPAPESKKDKKNK